jgi:hypothetical protein
MPSRRRRAEIGAGNPCITGSGTRRPVSRFRCEEVLHIPRLDGKHAPPSSTRDVGRRATVTALASQHVAGRKSQVTARKSPRPATRIDADTPSRVEVHVYVEGDFRPVRKGHAGPRQAAGHRPECHKSVVWASPGHQFSGACLQISRACYRGWVPRPVSRALATVAARSGTWSLVRWRRRCCIPSSRTGRRFAESRSDRWARQRLRP